MWTPDPATIITAEAKAAQAQADLGAAIDVERERRIALPLAVTLSVGTFSIDMDDDSQRNLNGLATAGLMLNAASSTQTTPFRDHDNQMHDLTPDDLVAMGAQVMARISAMYADSWALKGMTTIPADYTADSYWQ